MKGAEHIVIHRWFLPPPRKFQTNVKPPTPIVANSYIGQTIIITYNQHSPLKISCSTANFAAELSNLNPWKFQLSSWTRLCGPTFLKGLWQQTLGTVHLKVSSRPGNQNIRQFSDGDAALVVTVSKTCFGMNPDLRPKDIQNPQLLLVVNIRQIKGATKDGCD